MPRKKFLVVVIILAIFCSLFPQIACAREFIAEEEAEKNQVGYGDVTVEKQIESVMMPLQVITAPAGLGGAIAKNATKKVVLYSVSAEGVNLSSKYDGTSAVWMNWPAGRYVFGTADVNKLANFIPTTLDFIPVWIVNMIANKLFDITKTLVVLGLNIIILAFNTHWTDSIAVLVGDIVSKMVDFNNNGFFKLFFLLGICGLTISIIFKLLKAQITQTLTALLISGIMVATIMGWAANCDKAILWMTDMTDSLAGSSMAMLTNAISLDDIGQIPGKPPLNDDPMNKGLRAAGNAAWQTMVVHPWAAVMFGTLDPNKLKLTTEEWNWLESEIDKTYVDQLKAKGTLYLDSLYLGSAADDKIRTSVCTAIANQEIKDHGEHKGATVLLQCSTANSGRFLWTAFISIFPALAFFILAVLVGCSIIFCQFALIVMLIGIPFVLLVALFPDSGWNFALGYGKRMLGFFSVKIIYGLFLGVVLYVGTAASIFVQTSTGTVDQSQLGTVMFLLTIMFAGAAFWRKKILDMATSFSVNVQSSSKAINPVSVINEIRRTKRFLGVADFASDYLTRDKKYKEGTPPSGHDSDGGNSSGGNGGAFSQQRSVADDNGEVKEGTTSNENMKAYQRLTRDRLQQSREENDQDIEDERSGKGYYRLD